MTAIVKQLLKALLPSKAVVIVAKKKKKIQQKCALLTHKHLTSRLDSSYALVKGPLTYHGDGLATRHNCDFMKDELFLESYHLGKSTGSWHSADCYWRAYVVCWAANQAKLLEGDFVECGVYKGGYSTAAMHYITFEQLHKRFYLVDTFCGIYPEYVSEEERKIGIGRACCTNHFPPPITCW